MALVCLGLSTVCGVGLSAHTVDRREPAASVPAPDRPLDGPALFRERGCIHCHEICGVGGHKGPDLSGVGRHLKDAAIEKQIVEGGDAMPAFGEAIPAPEIATLVKYLHRCRQRQHRERPPARPAEPTE